MPRILQKLHHKTVLLLGGAYSKMRHTLIYIFSQLFYDKDDHGLIFKKILLDVNQPIKVLR
jgi:hypothetical protein